MTTIAIRKYSDRIELAADSLGNDDGIVFKKNKIFAKTDCNFIFAHTGNSDQALIFNNYILNNYSASINKYGKEDFYELFCKIKEKFSTDGEDIEHFLVAFNKKIYDLRINKSSVDFTEIQEDFYAGGHGRAFALAAMELGKSPKQAIEIASIYDIYTGGMIQQKIINFKT